MPFLFYDPTILLLIPALAIAFWAQVRVKATFKKYNRVPANSGLTGKEVASRLLSESGLPDVQVEEIEGKLSDHYDPRKKVLRLSASTGRSRSVAAIGVAAHEVGHAVQHRQSYTAFQIRQSIFPVARFGSSLAFPLFFIGFLFTAPRLMDVGILLFSAAVVFQVATLPVEFNASSRALTLLRSRGILINDEVNQAEKVLQAAALTYVAATAVAALQLLRLILLRGARD